MFLALSTLDPSITLSGSCNFSWTALSNWPKVIALEIFFAFSWTSSFSKSQELKIYSFPHQVVWHNLYASGSEDNPKTKSIMKYWPKILCCPIQVKFFCTKQERSHIRYCLKHKVQCNKYTAPQHVVPMFGDVK